MIVVVVISAVFTLWRFATPGHAVSPAGSVEAMAHVWMGILLMAACYETVFWARNHSRPGAWYLWLLPWADRLVVCEPYARPSPWLLNACWLVPSLVELVLFLRSPFNPF